MTAASMLDQLAERDAAVRAAAERVREIKAEAATAGAAAAEAREALVEAFASGDQAAEKALTKAKTTAEARAAEPWTERQTGAERAAARAKGDRDLWVGENIAALLAELAPSAHAAAEAITNGAQALGLARKEWHATGQRVGALLAAVPGSDPRSIPGIEHIDTAIRDVLRATADVPAPLPAALRSARIVPAHDVPAGVRLGDPEKFDAKDKFAQTIANRGAAA